MTGGEIAAIIGAFFGGLGACSVLFWRIVNARTANMTAETKRLHDIVDLSNAANKTVAESMEARIRQLTTALIEVQKANNLMAGENNQLRSEISALRGKLEEQARQIAELQNENALLRQQVDDYRSGRKTKTGPLPKD